MRIEFLTLDWIIRCIRLTTVYNEKYFLDNQFSYNNYYSPCPNLEGIKDALSYKFVNSE